MLIVSGWGIAGTLDYPIAPLHFHVKQVYVAANQSNYRSTDTIQI